MKRFVGTAAIVGTALAIGGAIYLSDGPSVAMGLVNQSKPTSVTQGLYQVGRDIDPGIYRTPGFTDPKYGLEFCAAERMRDNSGSTSADNLLGVTLGEGPRSITVVASDGYLNLTGPCVWTLDGKPVEAPAPAPAPAKPLSTNAPSSGTVSPSTEEVQVSRQGTDTGADSGK